MTRTTHPVKKMSALLRIRNGCVVVQATQVLFREAGKGYGSPPSFGVQAQRRIQLTGKREIENKDIA